MGIFENSLALKRIVTALVVFSSSVTYADGFDISLNNEAASLVYLDQATDLGEGGTDIGYGVFFNHNDDFILNANFLVVGEPAMQRIPGSLVWVRKCTSVNTLQAVWVLARLPLAANSLYHSLIGTHGRYPGGLLRAGNYQLWRY